MGGGSIRCEHNAMVLELMNLFLEISEYRNPSLIAKVMFLKDTAVDEINILMITWVQEELRALLTLVTAEIVCSFAKLKKNRSNVFKNTYRQHTDKNN
jgi:hypothetical protein